MNPLTDGLPESIEIDGAHYSIRSDFRVWVQISLLLDSDEEADPLALLQLCYPKLPHNLEKAFEGLIWFAGAGAVSPETKESPALPKQAAEQGFSFAEDYVSIYAGFLEAYRIDLFREQLHWWAFRFLMDALPENTLFKRIVQIRTVKITSKMSKSEREYYKKMKEIYALKQGSSERLSYQEYKDRMIRYVSRRMGKAGPTGR